MSMSAPTLRTMPPQRLLGIEAASSDRTLAADIPRLSKQYYERIGSREVVPFYVVYRDYDPATGKQTLFIGSERPAEGLGELTLPEGRYAETTLRPKLGFLWGAAVGAAKRTLYRDWLPARQLVPRNLEYECHTKKDGRLRVVLAVAIEE